MNKIFESVDVHVKQKNANWLEGEFNRTVIERKNRGWEVESVTPYNGQEWDYPRNYPTIGYNILFVKK